MTHGITAVTEMCWDCDMCHDGQVQALQQRPVGMRRRDGPPHEGAAGVHGSILWDG